MPGLFVLPPPFRTRTASVKPGRLLLEPKIIFMPKSNFKAKNAQLSIRSGPEGELLLPNGTGAITFEKEFLTSAEADRIFDATLDAKSWARTPISFFGKSVLQPRDTAFFGTKLYSYSDERRQPTGWNDDLPASTAIHALGRKIELHLGLPQSYFNVVLANRYNNGSDYMGWHDDGEKSLGETPLIASISVGARRRFVLRSKAEKHHKIEYTLGHGSLLVMKGKTQKFYQHSLPKVAISKCNDVRINLTYRRVIDEDEQRS